MSSEGTDYDLPIGTKKITWIFVPMYNNTDKLEWIMHYSIDTCVECSSWDMSKIQYCIYNYDTSSWTTIDSADCHLFYGDYDGNQVYIGHLTNQVVYYYTETDVSDYISADGYVKIGIDFGISTGTNESEIHYNSAGADPQEYVNRPAIIRVYKNSLIVS